MNLACRALGMEGHLRAGQCEPLAPSRLALRSRSLVQPSHCGTRPAPMPVPATSQPGRHARHAGSGRHREPASDTGAREHGPPGTGHRHRRTSLTAAAEPSNMRAGQGAAARVSCDLRIAGQPQRLASEALTAAARSSQAIRCAGPVQALTVLFVTSLTGTLESSEKWTVPVKPAQGRAGGPPPSVRRGGAEGETSGAAKAVQPKNPLLKSSCWLPIGANSTHTWFCA